MSCSWPIDRTCIDAAHPLPPVGDDPDDPSAEYLAALAQRNAAEDLAVFIMWSLSGRQFGVCPTRVRPCVSAPWSPGYRPPPYIWFLDAGHWVDYPCGCGPSRCEVSGPSVVHLPGPAQPDTQDSPIVVKIAGVELAHDAYVLEGDALYRREGVWPSQNLARPAGEVGTWTVDYGRGIPAPACTAGLVGQLAKEFIAACGDTTACRLPRNVTATVRQGVSKSFDSSQVLAAIWREKKTGLFEVDAWLAAVNPSGLAAAPVVL